MAMRCVKKEASLADKAYAAIKAAVIAAELPPGEALAEETLAEQLGISRTPIRAALQRLLCEEIVVQQGKKLVVADVTEQDVRDINAVRLRLEPLCAALIGAQGGLTAAQLERLRACNKKQAAAADRGDSADFLDCDYRFHALLAQLTGNRYLLDFIEKSNLIVKRFHVLSGTLQTHSAAAIEEHQAILDALAQRDYDRAEAAVRLHLEQVDRRFFQPRTN